MIQIIEKCINKKLQMSCQKSRVISNHGKTGDYKKIRNFSVLQYRTKYGIWYDVTDKCNLARCWVNLQI